MKTFDSPRDRLQTVTLGLISHKSGPNILLGLFLGAAVQNAAPTPAWWVVGSGLLWAASVLAYSVADEVRQAIEEERRRLLDPLGGRPRGIE